MESLQGNHCHGPDRYPPASAADPLLLAVFSRSPSKARPGIARLRYAYLLHPRRRLPHLRGVAWCPKSLDPSADYRLTGRKPEQDRKSSGYDSGVLRRVASWPTP